MKRYKVRDFSVRICFGLLVCLLISILTRFFTRQILIERFHIDNSFTRLVFWGNADAAQVAEGQEEDQEEVEIDWQELYPFREEDWNRGKVSEKVETSVADRWTEKISGLEEKIEVYTGELLVGYMQSVEWMNRIEEAVGWDIASYSEYNGVIELEDGQLTECRKRVDVTENVESVAELYNFCEGKGIDFLYVQTPYKISQYQDDGISGVLDFSNQNADDLLDGLKRKEISFLDLRDLTAEREEDYHSLFYVTDHHWKVETGLWAANVLAEYLNQNYDYNIELSLLKPEQFCFQNYEDWFLGSYGKKVTLARTKPDNFTEIYPQYETEFTYDMPSLGMQEQGDFKVLYDQDQIREKDYYGADPYLAYLYGGGPVIHIHNEQVEGKKILFIKDSFAISVIPFLALGVEETDVLDVREFDGSAKAFIEECQPDMVVVFYNPSSIREIDWPSHLSAFDFR